MMAYANEAKTIRALGTLRRKQADRKAFATETKALKIDAADHPGYELLIRVSADGKRWIQCS